LPDREGSLEVRTSPPQVCAVSVDHEGMPPAQKFVECWRSRYRDPKTGRICQTLSELTESEAAELPQAERIEGSSMLRAVEDDGFPWARQVAAGRHLKGGEESPGGAPLPRRPASSVLGR
jgi:hypothetical protein